MTELGRPIEPKVLAGSLQDKLKKFTSQEDLFKREKMLIDVANFIMTKGNITGEVLRTLIDRDFQPKLEKAVDKSLQTSFDINGKKINPWIGGFTVVALDMEGNIKGAMSKPTEGLESYGDLHPYALMKAVEAFHLDKNNLERHGLKIPQNIKYLTDLLKMQIFNGCSRGIQLGETKLYVGGSGCAVKRDYLKELLGGAEPAPDTQAGRFDTIFCDLIGDYLRDSQKTANWVREPQELQVIRINN
jgi:hypothetical protein